MLDPDIEEAFAAELAEFQRKYETGDGHALFSAITVCGLHSVPMPDWVVTSFIASYSRYGIDTKDLGEAFGIVWPKRERLASTHKAFYHSTSIMVMIDRLLEDGRPIDESLFDEVGDRLGISGGTVRDHYYKCK